MMKMPVLLLLGIGAATLSAETLNLARLDRSVDPCASFERRGRKRACPIDLAKG